MGSDFIEWPGESNCISLRNMFKYKLNFKIWLSPVFASWILHFTSSSIGNSTGKQMSYKYFCECTWDRTGDRRDRWASGDIRKVIEHVLRSRPILNSMWRNLKTEWFLTVSQCDCLKEPSHHLAATCLLFENKINDITKMKWFFAGGSLDLVGISQLQCMYYLVSYTELGSWGYFGV